MPSTGSSGSWSSDELLHRRVGRGVVRLVGGAVAEQVDGERRRGPTSASRSSQPLSPQVRALEVAKPWTRTTGAVTIEGRYRRGPAPAPGGSAAIVNTKLFT